MWPQIEADLTKLLSSKVFAALRGLPAYDKLLRTDPRTGATQPDPALCAAFSKSIVQTTDLQSGIREIGTREPTKVQEWTKPLCRGIAPGRRVDAYWWFDEELVQRWARQYPPGIPGRSTKILESIRPMLAVCKDWNDLTELRVMRLPGPIPVITGMGQHKQIYSPSDPQGRGDPKVVFIGGFTQCFVPLVNPALISFYPL